MLLDLFAIFFLGHAVFLVCFHWRIWLDVCISRWFNLNIVGLAWNSVDWWWDGSSFTRVVEFSALWKLQLNQKNYTKVVSKKSTYGVHSCEIFLTKVVNVGWLVTQNFSCEIMEEVWEPLWYWVLLDVFRCHN